MATSNDTDFSGPEGEGNYLVRRGDCLESIAAAHGFFWQTLWDLPENAMLKAKRKDPNLLLSGDRLTIPEPRTKQEPGETEQRQRFKRRGVPSKFNLRILDEDDEPMANQPCMIDIDGVLSHSKLDSNGEVNIPIPPGARQGKLILTESGEEFDLSLGHMDPIESLTGIQGRLENLGYEVGKGRRELDEDTRVALQEFQSDFGLQPTGEPSQATRDKLVEIHGA